VPCGLYFLVIALGGFGMGVLFLVIALSGFGMGVHKPYRTLFVFVIFALYVFTIDHKE